MKALVFSILLIFTLAAFAQKKPLSIDQIIDASGAGNTTLLKKFKVEQGNFNGQNSQGITPLMQAVATGQKNSVAYLLEKKVNLELKNKNGDTALVMAIANNHDQIALSLIKAGAKIDVLGSEDQNNLVYMAASANTEKTLEYLCKKAPEQIHAKNKKGETALHEAARFGSDKTIKVLLEAGAKKDIKNNEGLNPLEVAKSIQNEIAIKLLSPAKPN